MNQPFNQKKVIIITITIIIEPPTSIFDRLHKVKKSFIDPINQKKKVSDAIIVDRLINIHHRLKSYIQEEFFFF